VRSSSLNRRATLSWPRRALVWRVSLHKQSAEKSLFPAPAPAMHALAPTHCTRTQTYTANLDSEMVQDDMQSNPLAPEGPDSVVEGSTLDPTYVSVQPPFHRIAHTLGKGVALGAAVWTPHCTRPMRLIRIDASWRPKETPQHIASSLLGGLREVLPHWLSAGGGVLSRLALNPPAP
jgi:hypothetical protein